MKDENDIKSHVTYNVTILYGDILMTIYTSRTYVLVNLVLICCIFDFI